MRWGFLVTWGTGHTCLAPSTVKSTLTLMLSCGMYDYSGEWCIRVGLPAKSGAPRCSHPCDYSLMLVSVSVSYPSHVSLLSSTALPGVAGLVYIVIPNVMGIAVYSPPLDSVGNSVRAVTFFKHLMQVRACAMLPPPPSNPRRAWKIGEPL